MTALQQKITALSKSQQKEVNKFIDGLLQNSNESQKPLTKVQKAMLERSEFDIKEGKLVSQAEVEIKMKEWLSQK